MQVLHRDLKSDNLMLSEPGRAGDIRVVDFGLTKLASASCYIPIRGAIRLENTVLRCASLGEKMTHKI